LNGADFDVGSAAGFIEAEAGDPNLAFAEHGSLRVDEQGIIFLFQDGLGDVDCDDAVVVLDEFFWGFNGEGMLAGVDLDGIVNKGGDGGRIVAGNRLLEIGEEVLDFDVISDHHVDGFIDVGRACLGRAESRREECACEQGQACEFGADGHSISVNSIEDSSRGIGYTSMCETCRAMND
jgi:hypothetical protein